MPDVPATIDIIQEHEGHNKLPEIRVWCHPLKGGDDFYYVFDTFMAAAKFITKPHKTYVPEKVPLLAFKGWELNLFNLKPYKGDA